MSRGSLALFVFLLLDIHISQFFPRLFHDMRSSIVWMLLRTATAALSVAESPSCRGWSRHQLTRPDKALPGKSSTSFKNHSDKEPRLTSEGLRFGSTSGVTKGKKSAERSTFPGQKMDRTWKEDGQKVNTRAAHDDGTMVYGARAGKIFFFFFSMALTVPTWHVSRRSPCCGRESVGGTRAR